jgi:hypothetical protein
VQGLVADGELVLAGGSGLDGGAKAVQARLPRGGAYLAELIGDVARCPAPVRCPEVSLREADSAVA